MTTSYSCDKHDLLARMNGRWAQFYGEATELKDRGRWLRGACPIHHGKDDNFEVDTETGNWRCHSQCSTGGDVFSFIQTHQNTTFLEALTYLSHWVGLIPERTVPTNTARTADATEPQPTYVDHYDYHDELGRVLYQVVRYDNPKTFRQRSLTETGFYTWNTKDVRKVIYKLPEVLAGIAAGKTVWVVEGEKDVERLRSLGFCATCNSGGSGQWLEEFSIIFHGAKVAIVPDNDEPGRTHAEKVAKSLYTPADQIRIVHLPDLPPKGDVSDFLDAGGTREDLIQHMKAAPRYKPVETPTTASPAATTTRTSVPMKDRVIDLADVPPPPQQLPYLFGPYLNTGASHWITGQTGLGKSTLMFNIMIALAEGKELWGIPCEPQTIIYVDSESGDIGRSMKISRLYGTDKRTPGRLFFMRLPVNLPNELADFIAFAKEIKATIVVFDTARRCFSVKDENDNAEVYRSVIPCLDGLKAEGIATVVLGHPCKSGATGARGAGAQEDAGDVNLSLTMHKGDVSDDEGIIVLKPTKNRLLGMGILPLYLRRIGDDRFERVDIEVDNKQGGAAEKPVETSAVKRCRTDIADMLSSIDNRKARHQELQSAIMSLGHSEATFARAMRAMRDDHELLKREDGQWELTDLFSDEYLRLIGALTD